MYVYFDNNGVLKEIITERPFRAGDSQRDKIYIYWEGEHTPTAGWVKYRKADGTFTTETSIILTQVNKTLPTDPLQNLRYFSYEHTYTDGGVVKVGYPFYQLTVPSEVLTSAVSGDLIPTSNNMCAANVRFVFSDSSIDNLGVIVFSVETSIGILTDNSISETQYNYLIAEISQKFGLNYPFRSVKVNELPAIGETGTIYYVKIENEEIYEVYYWNVLTAAFVMMGTTSYGLYTQEEGTAFENEVNEKLDDMTETIEGLGNLEPSGTDTSTNILAFTENKGIYVGTDTGHWYYWNGTQYVDGGLYQAVQIANKSINLDKLSDEVIDYIDEQGKPTQEQVDNWLDEHPEATTTVQDGSLTDAKFSNDLKLKTIKDYVIPEMFGAVGDGVVDDTTAFNNMFTYINNNLSYDIKLTSNKTYLINSSLSPRDNLIIDGNFSTIITSAPFIDKSTPTHDLRINNLKIKALNNSTNFNLINLCCFYTIFDNCTFLYGNVAINLINGSAAGTLVENQIRNCIFRNNVDGIYTQDGGKLTDGLIFNCYFASQTSHAIRIGSSSGWMISDVHTYVLSSVNYNIALVGCFNTLVNNVYTEGGTYGLYLQVQKNVCVNNYHCTSTTNGIRLENSSYYPLPDYMIQLNNINIEATNNAIYGYSNYYLTNYKSNLSGGFVGNSNSTKIYNNNHIYSYTNEPNLARYKDGYLSSKSKTRIDNTERTYVINYTTYTGYVLEIFPFVLAYANNYAGVPTIAKGNIVYVKKGDNDQAYASVILDSENTHILFGTPVVDEVNHTISFTGQLDNSNYYGFIYIEQTK